MNQSSEAFRAGSYADKGLYQALPAKNGGFVIGTARCGSTLVSNILNTYPNLLSVSEFFSGFVSQSFASKTLSADQFWKMLSVRGPSESHFLTQESSPEFLYQFSNRSAFDQSNLPPILAVTLPHVTDDPDNLFFALQEDVAGLPDQATEAQYEWLFNWLADRMDCAGWVERSGASLLYVRSLINRYPEARFLHLYRDGRDVALSMQKHPPSRYLVGVWSDLRKLGIDILKRPFRIGESRMVADVERYVVPLLRLEQNLNREIPLKEFGRFWSALIDIAFTELPRLPAERRLELRYEELVANPREQVERLISFFDPAFEQPSLLDDGVKLIHDGGSRWVHLPKDEQDALTRACAPGLEALGYI